MHCYFVCLQISVTVLDENDNAPQLVEDTYELTRPENIPVGTTLITLSAMDPDLGENSTLNYRILSGDTRCQLIQHPLLLYSYIHALCQLG